MSAFGIDLIICPKCWPKVVQYLRLLASGNMDVGPIPGNWTDDPDDASECDICGEPITELDEGKPIPQGDAVSFPDAAESE